MVIHTERSPQEERLIAAFRGTFDASVMNFGAYNLLYAENLLGRESAAGEAPPASAQEAVVASRRLLVGYRRDPVEMVLCPVQWNEVLPRVAHHNDAAPAAVVPAQVNMTNVAGLATEGSTVEIALSTGRTVKLDVRDRVVFDDIPEIPLHQELDVEDFYSFLDHFMDTVERYGQ